MDPQMADLRASNSGLYIVPYSEGSASPLVTVRLLTELFPLCDLPRRDTYLPFEFALPLLPCLQPHGLAEWLLEPVVSLSTSPSVKTVMLEQKK